MSSILPILLPILVGVTPIIKGEGLSVTQFDAGLVNAQSVVAVQVDAGTANVQTLNVNGFIVTGSTVGSLTLFVDGSLGNDSNGCTSSGSGACLTMQGVERKIPKNIRHPVTVSVATGNYACSSWENFNFSSDFASGQYGSLWVHGTTQAASITGSQSGTVASATDITNVAGVLPTVTASGSPGWTPHALRGLLFNVTSGTGAGETLTISDNTASVLTLAGGYSTSTAFWPASSVIVGMCQPFDEYTKPDATSHFAILTNGTHITSDCAVPTGPGTGNFMGAAPAQALDTYGILITGVRGGGYQGSYTNAGNTEQGYCSPQAGIAFTNFDFNDANMGAGFYGYNSDSIQVRWNSFSNIYFWDAIWQHVGRASLFSNYSTSGCLLGSDAYSGDTVLLVGNVVGLLDNSKGCLQYDGQSITPGPRVLLTGLNSYYTHGLRSGFNVVGTSIFQEFDDTISGPSVAAVVINQSNTAVTYTASFGTQAWISDNNFLPTGGEGVFVGPGTYLYSTGNAGSGGTFGYKIVGPVTAYFDSNPNDTLTGSTGNICQDPGCASAVQYGDVSTKNIFFAPQGGAHNTQTGNLSVPTTTGCTDNSVTARGAIVNTPCYASPDSNPNSAGGATWSCYPSAAGTIQLRLCCVTATCTANSIKWNVGQQ